MFAIAKPPSRTKHHIIMTIETPKTNQPATNSFARSVFGLAKKSFGGCYSTTRPSSIKVIRCAIRLAKFNSCVTQIMLIPSLANATMVSRTSLIFYFNWFLFCLHLDIG